ncbi:hypothetical protein U1Q18_052028, partial [Sarracenia purpurea var. burkii]
RIIRVLWRLCPRPSISAYYSCGNEYTPSSVFTVYAFRTALRLASPFRFSALARNYRVNLCMRR